MPLHDASLPAASGLQVCRDGEAVPATLRGAVAAIGNFDGVHRGHAALIEATRAAAAQAGRAGAVLTFEPHPRTYFRPEAPLFRLTPEPVKLALLARRGLDGVFVRRFDEGLAALSADAFVTRFLREELGVSGVVVGHDFHFGRGREGTPDRLRTLCADNGIGCTIVPAVTAGDQVVSSSAIRAALERGDVAAANALLGYRWLVRGEVRHGQKRGRTLGYPTANLRLPDEARLRHGIYAVRASLGGGAVHDGVASFGRRPTFDNGAPLLEAFLFDFAGDLYGRILDVELVGWVRGEERFDGAEALVARMHQDSREARAMLAADRTPSMIG
ncbi:MAG TPA: bifunctional riboflavin kinase/FAD synthetase [Microvirga sp.]|jgi:riboflavin kinase/FMN adenylyltransferase|nr:bifunctional riboflavin kinase/FAD synthetase [Microvirga sp.]